MPGSAWAMRLTEGTGVAHTPRGMQDQRDGRRGCIAAAAPKAGTQRPTWLELEKQEIDQR